MAKLYFRYGAMNCGKSTHLLQVAHNYEERGMDVVLLKPSVDKKGEDRVVSRLVAERKVDALVAPDDSIMDILEEQINEKNNIKCILVDEAQFLNRNQVDELLFFATDIGIPVICQLLRAQNQYRFISILIIFNDRKGCKSLTQANRVGQDTAIKLLQFINYC